MISIPVAANTIIIYSIVLPPLDYYFYPVYTPPMRAPQVVCCSDYDCVLGKLSDVSSAFAFIQDEVECRVCSELDNEESIAFTSDYWPSIPIYCSTRLETTMFPS